MWWLQKSWWRWRWHYVMRNLRFFASLMTLTWKVLSKCFTTWGCKSFSLYCSRSEKLTIDLQGKCYRVYFLPNKQTCLRKIMILGFNVIVANYCLRHHCPKFHGCVCLPTSRFLHNGSLFVCFVLWYGFGQLLSSMFYHLRTLWYCDLFR